MSAKAATINLRNFSTPQMRAFHMSWFSFFLCFFGWFAFPALAKVVIDDLGISKAQFVTTSQWAVGSTIFVRILIGWLCDRIGPRLTYTWLLSLGAIPVALGACVQNYEQLLFVRIFIGAIGASFVITQYHTTAMFAPNIVGTANATTAGWGNLGGGVTQKGMPFIMLGLAFFGDAAWRYAMIIPAMLMIFTAFAYSRLTQDCPEGAFQNTPPEQPKNGKQIFFEVCKDYRVWLLFLIYGACFGIELIVNSKLMLYFTSDFNMDIQTAGLIAAIFGMMNIFARTLGGFFGDLFGSTKGLKGRTQWLFFVLFIEGMALMVFSRMTHIWSLIPALILFSLFVQMAEGATFSVVPFINKKSLGPVAGIVGAGGNAGAVFGMFLFKIESVPWADAFMILGWIVCLFSFLALGVRFNKADEKEVLIELQNISAANRA